MWPLDGIGKNIGSAAGQKAVDSAISTIEEKLKGFDLEKIALKIPVIGQLMPMWDGIKAGYSSMSDSEKAELWKNLLLALSKLAAKS